MNILKECQNAKKIGISGHVRPDGDCVGACLSLYQYLSKAYPEAEIRVLIEQPSQMFEILKGFDKIQYSYEGEKDFDVYFALDCAADRLGFAQDLFENAKKKINIDHHISNQGCGDVNYIEPHVGSTCELIYDLIEKEFLDQDLAKSIYIGMVHDTGVFQYSNTNQKTMEIAGHLISFGFDFPRIIEETFYQKSYEQTLILGRALLDSRRLLDNRVIATCVSHKTMEEFNVTTRELEGIVNQLRNVAGVHVAIFTYETDAGDYKVSMRADEKVNVSAIASTFGGGGHVRAAGCTLSGSYEEILEKITGEIEKQLNA